MHAEFLISPLQNGFNTLQKYFFAFVSDVGYRMAFFLYFFALYSQIQLTNTQYFPQIISPGPKLKY